MPFDGPGAPRIAESIRDRHQVVGHTSCQTCERLQITSCGVKQPVLECRHVKFMKRVTETLYQLVAGIKQPIRCQHALEIGAFLLFQQIWRAEEKPGHMTSEQPSPGLTRCFRWTPACNHPAHRGAFAAVTKLFDLASELTTIAAPIGPTLQQIWNEGFN